MRGGGGVRANLDAARGGTYLNFPLVKLILAPPLPDNYCTVPNHHHHHYHHHHYYHHYFEIDWSSRIFLINSEILFTTGKGIGLTWNCMYLWKAMYFKAKVVTFIVWSTTYTLLHVTYLSFWKLSKKDLKVRKLKLRLLSTPKKNRLFLSCSKPLFQSEAVVRSYWFENTVLFSCKWIWFSHRKKGFALSLVLKVRVFGTQK